MKGAERLALLRALWLQRPPNRRTENDVIIFYGELERTRPKLLKRTGGDPYRQLMTDLRDLIKSISAYQQHR
jgi:hypothetical protein